MLQMRGKAEKATRYLGLPIHRPWDLRMTSDVELRKSEVRKTAMKPWNGNALLAWIAAAGFFTAAAWPHFFASAFPFAGLQKLTLPLVGWPLALAALLMALFLSVPNLLSRDRLLICAGFSLCLFLVVSFYVSPAAALLFGFIGSNIIRDSAKGSSSDGKGAQDGRTG